MTDFVREYEHAQCSSQRYQILASAYNAKRHPGVCRLICASGPDVGVFMRLIEYGNVSMVQEMILCGLDAQLLFNIACGGGDTVTYTNSLRLDIAWMILNAFPKVNCRAGYVAAAKSGSVEFLHALRGDFSEWNILLGVAAQHGHVGIIVEVMRRGASHVNMALVLACCSHRSNAAVVQTLIDYGATNVDVGLKCMFRKKWQNRVESFPTIVCLLNHSSSPPPPLSRRTWYTLLYTHNLSLTPSVMRVKAIRQFCDATAMVKRQASCILRRFLPLALIEFVTIPFIPLQYAKRKKSHHGTKPHV